jgi:hypothetical protein
MPLVRASDALCHKIAAALYPWKRRFLSLQGRCLLASSMGESIARYQLYTLPFTLSHVTRMQRVLSEFIWQGKREHVSRAVMALPKDAGGRAAPLLERTVDAIHLQWVQRLFTDDSEPWVPLLISILRIVYGDTVGGLEFLRASPMKISRRLPLIWQRIFATWRRYNGGIAPWYAPHSRSQVLAEPLWQNPRIVVDPAPASWASWQRLGCRRVGDLQHEHLNRPHTLAELKRDRVVPASATDAALQLLTRAIPPRWLAVFFAPAVKEAVAFQAESGLEPVGRVVDAGMDDAAAMGAGLQAIAGVAFQEKDAPGSR